MSAGSTRRAAQVFCDFWRRSLFKITSSYSLAGYQRWEGWPCWSGMIRDERYYRSGIVFRILAWFGKYRLSQYQGNLSLQNSCSCMHITYLRLSACKESVQLVLERESKGLKVSNVRSSCTMMSSTKTLFPRFAFCLRFKYVLRPHVLGLQVFGFWT